MPEQIIIVAPALCYPKKDGSVELNSDGREQIFKAKEELQKIGGLDLVLTSENEKSITTAKNLSEHFQINDFLSYGKNSKNTCQSEAFKGIISFLEKQESKPKKVLLVADSRYANDFQFFLKKNYQNIACQIIKHDWH